MFTTVLWSQSSYALVGRGAGDVEPLVDAWVNRTRSLVLTLGNVERAGIDTVRRVGNSGVGSVRD